MIAAKDKYRDWSPDTLISEIRSMRAHILSEKDQVILDRLMMNMADARVELAKRNAQDLLARGRIWEP